MPIIETIAAAKALITLTSQVLDMFPNYDQRKKQEFHDLNLALEQEKAKQVQDRDDDLIMNLRDELTSFCIAFAEEVAKKEEKKP